MDIGNMDEKELKSLAFDLIRQRDVYEKDLNMVLRQLETVQAEQTKKVREEAEAKAAKTK